MFSALAASSSPAKRSRKCCGRAELMEEASLKVGEVTYYATQPWPFPLFTYDRMFRKAENRDVKDRRDRASRVRWLEAQGSRVSY